jgi:hypothetical protein
MKGKVMQTNHQSECHKGLKKLEEYCYEAQGRVSTNFKNR